MLCRLPSYVNSVRVCENGQSRAARPAGHFATSHTYSTRGHVSVPRDEVAELSAPLARTLVLDIAARRGMPKEPLGPDGKKLIRRLAASFAECSAEAKQYGACVKLHLESVQKGACEAEFARLQTCFRGALTKARARGQ